MFSTLQSRSCWQLTDSCWLRGLEGSLLWIDILSFLLPIWYIFEVVCWVFSTLNMFSFAFLSLFCCSCELTLVLKSCIYCKYVLRPSLRLGNFGPDRSLFGKVVEVVRFIRSHSKAVHRQIDYGSSVQFTTQAVCDLLRYEYRSRVRFATRVVCSLLCYDYRSTVRFTTLVVCDLLRYN